MDKINTLRMVLCPMLLQELGLKIDNLQNEQENIEDTLQQILNKMDNIDLDFLLKNDIMNSKSIKRRLIRIQYFLCDGKNIVNEWEHALFTALNSSRKDIKRKIDYDYTTTIWDALDKNQAYRKVGVTLLEAFEKKYDIPDAIYTVEQIKSIGMLKREFDIGTVLNMGYFDFNKWVISRLYEYAKMTGEGVLEARPKVYTLLAKLSPDLITAKQLKYITGQELVDILDRAIEDEKRSFIDSSAKYFPITDRKLNNETLREKFISILTRTLIA